MAVSTMPATNPARQAEYTMRLNIRPVSGQWQGNAAACRVVVGGVMNGVAVGQRHAEQNDHSEHRGGERR